MAQNHSGPARHPAPRPKKTWGAVKLDSLLPETLAPVLQQRGFATTALMTEWRDIVGGDIAQWTSPLEIRWPQRRGESEAKFRDAKTQKATLVVACASAFALDLGMASPRVIEAVNRRLGYGAIGTLQIKHAPLAPVRAPRPRPAHDAALMAKVDETLGHIEHDGLRQAMARLGAGVLEKEAVSGKGTRKP